ncbi:MAG: helix-turn-helix domain-containing protein, partial [Pseudonocardiaceae bacterium]
MVRGGDNGEMPNPWQAQLGAFIRAQRQLADLSLREMAALTRISNAYLSQVERGLHQPSLTVLRAIADGLGLTAEQLLAKAGWTQAGPDEHTDEDPDRVAPDASANPPANPPANTEDSIRRDPRLTEAQREALLGVYRSFIAGTS